MVIYKCKKSFIYTESHTRKESFMEIPKELFSNYELTVRATNVLKKAGILTIEDFISCTHDDFMQMENSGTKTANELFSLATKLKYGELPLPNPIQDAISEEKTYTFLGNDGFEYIDTPIENTTLSARPIHTLVKQGILFVSQILDLTEADIYNFPSTGKKTVEEILKYQKTFEYKKATSWSQRSNKSENLSNDTSASIITARNRMINSFCSPNSESLEFLSLSGRSYNSLRRNGINTIDQFQKLTEKQLKSFNTFGEKSIQEILQKQASIDFLLYSTQTGIHETCESGVEQLQNQKDVIQSIILPTVQAIVKSLQCKAAELYTEITQLFRKYPEIDFDKLINRNTCEEFIDELFILPSFVSGVKKTLCSFLTSHNWGTSKFQLEKCLPPFLMDHVYFEEILLEMQHEKLIFMNKDGLYELYYISAKDFAQSMTTERERDALLSRLDGQTLEEIGSRYNITRERTRQLILKVFKSAPRFYEDRYKGLFETYSFDLNDFLQITKENESIFHYLTTRYKRGDTSWKDLRFDDNFPISIQKSAERLSYKDYVFLRGEYVRKKRPELVEYVLRVFAQESIDFDFFKKKYNELLESIGLLENESFALNGRGQENQIASSDLTLWKYGRKFRYYNIPSYDFSSLIDTLDFGSYHDIEISTKKWFTDFPSLMSEYNIEDEYELHNLIKKLDLSQKFPEMTTKRMPNIEFGTSNRSKQALDLLFIHAPISNDDLAALFEKTYGVLSQTALANYFGDLEQYLHDGIYRIDFPELSDPMLSSLKEMLTENFYFLTKVREIYFSAFPCSDENLINPRALKQLGFRVFGEYIIKEKFSSAADYFRFCLITDDIVDLNQLPKGTKQLIAFYVELYKFRSTYDIIEYEPSQYINIRKLEKAEITKSDLYDYCKSVKHFQTTPFFTVYSLKKSGFSHKLDNLGFEDHFYGALLTEDKENFTALRLGNLNRIFTLGKNSFSLGEFLEWVVCSSEALYFDLDDLSEHLRDNYNIIADKYQLPEIAKSTELYYNQLTRKIYADYDVFLETV